MDTDDQHIAKDALTKLRKLLAEEDNLYLGETDVICTVILEFTDYNPEEALKFIKHMYTVKLRNEKWFLSLPLSKYEKILNTCVSGVLTERDNKGRRVYIVKLGKVDLTQHQPHEYSCLDDIWLEPCYREPETIKNGLIMIIDFNDAPWYLLKFCTPHNLKVNSDKAQMIPVKSVEYHIIGCNIIMNTMFSLIRPFLNERTQQKVFMHKNLETLYQHIDKKSLPPEYGGQNKFEPELYRKYVKENEAILTETALTGYRHSNKS